jgi:hypothetical protein
MKLLPYVALGLTQIVVAFLVPIHYQPIIGLARDGPAVSGTENFRLPGLTHRSLLRLR